MATEADRRVYGRTAATTADAVQIDVGLRQYMLRVYNYMALGVAVTAVVRGLAG